MVDHPDQISKPHDAPDHGTINHCLIIWDAEKNELRFEGKLGKPLKFSGNDLVGFETAPFALRIGSGAAPQSTNQ